MPKPTSKGQIWSAVLLAAICCVAHHGRGDDYYVTTTQDLNTGICTSPFPCSLRNAIMSANDHTGTDTIHVPPGTYNLTIPGIGENAAVTGDLDVLEAVLIFGAGAGSTVVDAQGIDRVFHLLHDAETWVVLDGMTIRGGDSSSDPSSAHGAGVACIGGLAYLSMCVIEDNETSSGHGGGLYQREGELLATDCVITGNHAHGGSGVAGYLAHIIVDRCTLTDNYASDFNLIGTGGAVWGVDGYTEIVNTTITDNESRLAGQPSGVFLRGGTAEIKSCTLALNRNDEVFIDPADPPDLVRVRNTVILGTCNSLGITSLGGNVEGPGDTCMLDSSCDVTGAAIPLHPLGAYGGPTPTMPPVLLAGNVVIDNPCADLHCWPTDQRHIDRPQDGDGDGTAHCDSGAVEYHGLIFGDGFDTGSTIRWTTNIL